MLSTRGQVFAQPSSRPPMLDIVQDLWHVESNPRGFLSLGVAENTLMHKELSDFISKEPPITSHLLTYGDGFSGSHKLKNAISTFITKKFSPFEAVESGHVSVTNGLGPAIEACAFTLCDPGDGILLSRPWYGSFPSDVSARAKAQIVPVSFGDAAAFSIDAIAAYETALLEAREKGIQVRAMILCNPHNPLGRCYEPDVLRAYMRFCGKHGLHLLSDEIYALSVWNNPEAPDAPGFTSVLSVDPTGLMDPGLLHVLWGMSKDFGANGIRLGCIISQHNSPFLQAVEANSYFTCPSALSDVATTSILSSDSFVEPYIQTNKSRLEARYATTKCFLEAKGIPYAKGSNAGFFVWVNLFALFAAEIGSSRSTEDLWALQDSLHNTMLEERVFLASGSAFGSDVPGWFRIVFAHEEEYLAEGLRRIETAMEKFQLTLQ